MADAVKKYYCRGAVVHPHDVQRINRFGGEKIIPVLNGFPYGRGGVGIVQAELSAIRAFDEYIAGADIVLDLWAFQDENWANLINQFLVVREALPEKEIKVICQMPFVWQYHKKRISHLLDVFVECKIDVVKDWTTINNFSKPIQVDMETRVKYTEYLRNYIDKRNLPLSIKIAGKVDKDNIVDFKKAGADIFGVSIHKIPSVIKSLEGYLKKK